MSQHKQQLGKEGEEIATAHLIKEEYKILARNYRSGRAMVVFVTSAAVLWMERKNIPVIGFRF